MAETNVSAVSNCGSHMKRHRTWSVKPSKAQNHLSQLLSPKCTIEDFFSGAVRSEKVAMCFLKL